MKVLIVGGGGREHAIATCVAKSPKVDKIYCAPGNAGIGQIAECVPIGAMEFDKIVTFAKEQAIDLTIVGMDDPLVGGLVDALEAEGLRAFGPRKNAAILEGSKAFSKDLMKKYNIPTAAYENFTDPAKAIEYLKTEAKFPIVLKADGLALGKGVLICKDLEEAAVVDGANILQQIWYVQLPAIKNIIVIQFILQAGNIMSIGFEKAYALQTDMNLPASEILSTYVYRIGLLNGDYGYSTAVGLFNSVINVILLIFVNWVVKKLNDGEGL